jgi:hypothetical protein
MIKVMLIIASLNVNTVMPDMDSCLKARLAVMEQDSSVRALCVPINKAKKDPFPENFEKMMSIFLDMIGRLKEQEEIDRLNDEENRFCEDCPDRIQVPLG